jgi:hypothetical protein
MNRKQTPQLNDKALELISAYLDGQLPDAQRAEVRRRLAQDAAFKQAFEDLRMTRLALRRAPQIKRRRSFTLTPDMIARPARVFGLQATSRLVAMVATVLLVAVFASDMLFYRSSGSLSLASENFAADSVMQNSDEIEIMSADEAAGGGGEPPMALGAADDEATEEAEAAMAVEAAEAPTVDEGADDTAAETRPAEGENAGADTGEAEDQGYAAPEATQTKEPEGTKVPEQERAIPTGEPGAGYDEGEAPMEEPTDGEVMMLAVPTEDEENASPKTFIEEIPLISMIELSLLAVAIGSGAVALMSRRR